MKPQRRALEMCSSHHFTDPVDDLTCCRHKCLGSEIPLCVKERFESTEGDVEVFLFPQEWLDQQLIPSFDVVEAVPMEMSEMYYRLLRHESILATPHGESLTKCRECLLQKIRTLQCIFPRDKPRDRVLNTKQQATPFY